MKLLMLFLSAASVTASAQPLCGHLSGFKIYPANSPMARDLYLNICHKGPRDPQEITISVTAQKFAEDKSIAATLDRVEHGPSEFLCVDTVSAGDLENLHLEFVSFDQKDFAGNPVTPDGKCPPPTYDRGP